MSPEQAAGAGAGISGRQVGPAVRPGVRLRGSRSYWCVRPIRQRDSERHCERRSPHP